MSRNFIVHTAGSGPVAYAARIAAASGEDRGLVLTAIDFHREKVSGGRIEEERDYAGVSFNTFDEPVFIGSAIAQLAGHAEAVVVDGLEDWAVRLQLRFPDDPIELDAEISSLLSVMQARMTDLILIARTNGASELTSRILDRVEALADAVVEVPADAAAPRARKGTLPV